MSMQDSHAGLLLRYLDDTLSAEDRAEAEDLLRHSADARLMLREMAEQAVVFADVERVTRGIPKGTAVEVAAGDRLDIAGDRSGGASAWTRSLLGIAIAALLTFTVSKFFPIGNRERETVKVVAFNGPLEWTGDGGRVEVEVAIGQQLHGGTLELLAPDSWIEVEFRDRSRVTLAGLTAATIAAGEDQDSQGLQKRVHLRYGRLSATVQPQPAGRPMLVDTPSATMRVLGTQFNIVAQPEVTHLTVNEGRVRLKRLTDGREVEVPARRSVISSLEDEGELTLSERGGTATVWRSDLRSDVVEGKWMSNLWMLGAKLKKAVATGEMGEQAANAAFRRAATLDDASGSVWAVPSQHGTLVVLSLPRSAEQPIRLSENSRLRVCGRVHSQTALRIGLSAYRPNGGFAGKHSTVIGFEELPGLGEDFQIDLPIGRFLNGANSVDALIGNELVDWWCVAEKLSAKIEITRVELLDNTERDET